MVWHDLEAHFEITAEMLAGKPHGLPSGFMWYIQFDTCSITPWNGIMVKPTAVKFNSGEFDKNPLRGSK
jgi:hypothetical protein